MINVLADRYLFNIQSYLPENINLILFDPAEGLPDISSVHALLIRTVIQINKTTLPAIPKSLEFVGTASAGTDHVDISYLESHGVQFANAVGCNARSVAEYVATALLIWSDQRQKTLTELSMGVIGVGNVGTHVIRLMNKLGVSTTAYDPPREQRDPTFSSNSLEELLATDILSFHTPLTRDGAHPTYHWLDTKKLIKQNYELVLNTSRGGVIDEKAVLSAMDQGTIRDIIIDVWEGEPDFNLSTAKKAFIKTPHIAGYSVQAKERASNLAANAMLNHFGISHPELKTKSKPNVLKKEISEFDSLSALLDELHPLGEYETELQKIITNFENERAKYFNKLRAEFPLRQEFPQTYLPASYFKRFPILKAMGFSTAD